MSFHLLPGELVFRSGQNVQAPALPGIQPDVISSGFCHSWPAGDKVPWSQPLTPGRGPHCPQRSLGCRPHQSPRALGQASGGVQSRHLLLPHHPRKHLPGCSQFCWRYLHLHLLAHPTRWPAAPAPLEEGGLFVSGALAGCSAGRSQSD